MPSVALRRDGLVPAAAAGCAGSMLVVAGASQAASPFAEHAPGAWYVALGSPSSPGERTLGVLAVYGGLVLLGLAWLALLDSLQRRRRCTAQVAPLLAAWAAPLLVAPPLFSHDAYAYLADGALVDTGGNPYRSGPSGLAPGRLLELVDPIWRHSPPPYGPAFERLVGAQLALVGRSVPGALVLLRLDALVCLAVVAWAVPALARRVGRDGAAALAFGVCNPLVLMTLLGGLHNDALMLAFVTSGLVIAAAGRPLLGSLCCALGAEVKLPALLAVVFVAWWAGSGEPLGRRLARLVGHLAAAAGVLVALGAAAGLGYGFIGASLTPGAVVSWLDPATALGLGLAHLSAALGLGAHHAGALAGARLASLSIAAALTVALAWRSAPGWRPAPATGPTGVVQGSGTQRSGTRRSGTRRSGTPRSGAPRGGGLALPPVALGAAFLAVALLGPVVWPWYETWGIVLLAVAPAAVSCREPIALGALSLLGCLADFPPARDLAGGPVLAVAAGWGTLGLVVLAGSWWLALRVRSRPREAVVAGASRLRPEQATARPPR